VLFPGQGSQEVGMGAELFDARPDLLVETAERILGWSLRDVCLNGPIETLTRTDRAQPALFALAYALWSELISSVGHLPMAGAGHSLGEYTAFVAANAFSFEDGLRLVAARGSAMSDAAGEAPSGMAALLGAEDEKAEDIVAARRAEGGQIWVANLNAPGQVVVAGAIEDIDWLVSHASDVGVRKVVKLNVAGAFHTPFMSSAVDPVLAALATVSFEPLDFAIWSNVTGERVTIEDAPESLAAQVVSPVRFSASLGSMAGAGIDTFVHVGPGDVTAGMAKRAAKGSEILTVNSLESIKVATEALGNR
jgi:[acyl-carrier-protein] S-malonyltransferase